MKLLKPFSIQQKDPAPDYLLHRQLHRFVLMMGSGIHKVAKEHAETIAKANLKAGREISQSIKTGFEKVETQARHIHHALLDQTEVIEQGFDNIEKSLDRGFDKISTDIQDASRQIGYVEDAIVSSGEKLALGLSNLQAAMDMGMMNIVSQFELQRNEIKEGLTLLGNILENNRKTEANERYRDGKENYEKYLQHPDEPQFLQDALEYLLESVAIYRGNAFCHLYLGHIYQEPARFYDLEKSQNHYKLCATYAKGMPNNSLAALGYFMAAWISYVREDVDTAIELAEKVQQFDSDGIPENYFNLAKYHACKKDGKKALSYLDTAIQRFDPYYAVKASMDDDFKQIQDEMDNFFVEIRDNEAKWLDQHLLDFGVDPAQLSDGNAQ